MDNRGRGCWGSVAVLENFIPDPELDDQHTVITAQFPRVGELPAGELYGYDTGWHRVFGDRFDTRHSRS